MAEVFADLVEIKNSAGNVTIRLDANGTLLRIGTTGSNGNISVRDASDREVFQFDGNLAELRVGATGHSGDILVRNAAGASVIHLDGTTGDIILSNADAAEQFDVVDVAAATPGSLMVLNPEGKLQPASIPYDRKVIGVVAGAGRYRPAIVLDHRSGATSRVAISVLGKASCNADAAHGAIEVGDLLTTSPTPGHAMKASDAARMPGTVVGKALTPLREGVGIVDLLITLQ